MVLGIKVVFKLRKPLLDCLNNLFHNVINVIIAQLVEEIIQLLYVLIDAVTICLSFALVSYALEEREGDL